MLIGSIKKALLPLGISALCVGAIAYFQASALTTLTTEQKSENKNTSYQLEEGRLLASLKLLKNLPAFGFDNIIANWSYLSFLQYFGDKPARLETGYSLSPYFFDVSVKRDPRFIDQYLFLSTATSLYSGYPRKAVTLMEKGLSSLSPQYDPQSYLVWLYKATDELLFLGENQQARRSYLKVGEWAKYAHDEDSKRLKRLTASTAKFLEKKPDSKVAQINAWVLVLVNAVDEDARQRAIRNIEALGGQISFGDNGQLRVIHPQDN